MARVNRPKVGATVLSSIFRSGAAREEQLAHALRSVPLFRAAPARDLVALWRQLGEARLPSGVAVCRQGEPGDQFFIVQAGSVEVRLGTGQSALTLYRLGPGDCFGEMALLTGAPR